jgi:hypothetical protein
VPYVCYLTAGLASGRPRPTWLRGHVGPAAPLVVPVAASLLLAPPPGCLADERPNFRARKKKQ